MSKTYKENQPISRQKFVEELRRYQKGSVSRRHFLGVTGLGRRGAGPEAEEGLVRRGYR
jgi:spermidine/putrescine transport system substrate-binding protein